MRFSYIMNVINGEPFVKYQLDSIYPFADEIIIVEGAYKKFRHAATPEGHSVDTTIECIRQYPDPNRKIKLISKPGFYEGRKEMCDELLRHVTGDVIWQVDVDEFYFPETHEFIRKLFEADNVDRVSFNFHDLFGALKYYIKGYEWIGLSDVNRVHRFSSGDRWVSQRPPQLKTSDGTPKPARKHISGTWLEAQGHLMFHATLLFEKQVTDKYKYYSSLWKGISSSNNLVQKIWGSYRNKFFVAGIKNRITWLEPQESPLPSVLERLKLDVENNAVPGYQFITSDRVNEFFKSGLFITYRDIAVRLANYTTTSPRGGQFFKEPLALIKQISMNLDFHTSIYSYRLLGQSFFRHVIHLLKGGRNRISKNEANAAAL